MSWGTHGRERGWETAWPLDRFLAEVRRMSSAAYQPHPQPLVRPDNGGGRAARLAGKARTSQQAREIASDVARARAKGWSG